MKLYELPPDMQKEVKEVAARHAVTIEDALEYYMMGGFQHADYLCFLADQGMPKQLIHMVNNQIWEVKNKGIWEELKKLDGPI